MCYNTHLKSLNKYTFNCIISKLHKKYEIPIANEIIETL